MHGLSTCGPIRSQIAGIDLNNRLIQLVVDGFRADHTCAIEMVQGLVGMGGPPMVFWVQAHDWSTEKTRSFLFMMYLVSIFPALAFLYVAFGDVVIEPGLLALAMLPLLWLVTCIGLKFGSMLGRERLRRVTLGLLLLMGLAGVVGPMLN